MKPFLFAAALLATGLASAAPPHQHGVALLDVAYEAGKLSIALDSPLDNLIGFERAPRTDAERKAADAAVATLKAADTLFRIDPAAQCTLSNVTLESAPLKLGAADKKTEEGHADLDGSFEFACKGSAPAFVEVGMFKAFPRLQRLEVQVATAKGQSKVSLKRPAQRIELKH